MRLHSETRFILYVKKSSKGAYIILFAGRSMDYMLIRARMSLFVPY